MKTYTRDETEHGKIYYLASDVYAALSEVKVSAHPDELTIVYMAGVRDERRRAMLAAGQDGFYGLRQQPVSAPKAGGKCLTAGETAPIDPNKWAFDRGLEST